MSGRRVAVLIALAFLLGAGGAALAVEILRGPERSSVDPIELRVEDERPDDTDEERKKPNGRKKRQERNGGTQAPSDGTGDTTGGAPPAPPAPPAPAGDDDDDLDDVDDDGDDDRDDGDD
jgi:hypothetical protein